MLLINSKIYKVLLFMLPAFSSMAQLDDSLNTFTVKKNDNSSVYNNAGTVVSAVKMNVLYIGVDNPLEIAVPGIAAKNIAVAISEGTIKKVDDYYIAYVTKPGACLVSVSVNGKTVSRHQFRCKRVPDPVITLSGTLRGGAVTKGVIQAAPGLVALLENFDFDLRLSITSFNITIYQSGEMYTLQGTGPMLTTQMKNLLAKCKPKDVVFIDTVKVVFPDGQVRMLPGPTFTII